MSKHSVSRAGWEFALIERERDAALARLAEAETALRDAHHALKHLYPRPFAAPEQLDEYETWKRLVIDAGLGQGDHPCASGEQPCVLVADPAAEETGGA